MHVLFKSFFFLFDLEIEIKYEKIVTSILLKFVVRLRNIFADEINFDLKNLLSQINFMFSPTVKF